MKMDQQLYGGMDIKLGGWMELTILKKNTREP